MVSVIQSGMYGYAILFFWQDQNQLMAPVAALAESRDQIGQHPHNSDLADKFMLKMYSRSYGGIFDGVIPYLKEKVLAPRTVTDCMKIIS